MARATLDVPITCPYGPKRSAECAECVRQRLLQRAGVRSVEIRRNHAFATIELDYDADLLTRAELERDVTRSGGCFVPEWGHAVLPIQGMVSPQSEQLIEAALNRMPGVLATASYASQLVRVEFDKRKCLVPDILRTLRRIGYRLRADRSTVSSTEPPAGKRASSGPLQWTWRTLAQPELAFPLIGGVLLAAAWAMSTFGVSRPASLVLVALSYLFAARYTAIETVRTLRHLRFDVDVLMFLAASGAIALGRYHEGALLLVLFGLGTAGENLAMDKARGAIKALAKLAPETARIHDADGTERLVAVRDLRIGDQVVVRPFDRVPADGTVASGNSAVDQSPITGESIPVEKSSGSPLYAGTINGQGSLIVEVTRLADESKLAQIIRLVEEAQTTKSPTQALTDRVERWYVPGVLVATCMLITVPPLAAAGEWSTWFYRAMAFLTAASPCALAIGTPAAVLSGIARAARGGVLIKGGVHLENLGRVRAVAFDKTGTLTRGRPKVTDVVTLANMDADQLLALAASVEQQSTHPLAAAIVVEAQVRGCKLQPTDEVEQMSGAGVKGTVAAKRVFVGHSRRSEAFANDTKRRAVEQLESAGRTVVVVTVDDQPAGVLGLIDPPRSNSADVMKRLADLGVKRSVMITGDNARVASQIARTIGVQEHYANLMPADKVTILKRIESEAGHVAMVGDGVNDAPALAAATVGIAMGTAGADVALETADVALMADDLGKLPEAIGLSRFSRRIIAQNLIIALGVIAMLAPAAALGYASLGLAVVFHEGSTVLVVLNALRLLAYRDKSSPPPE